jgi:hypothetical protein
MAPPPQLRAAPDPVAEPIVLVIEGQTHVVGPNDPAWPIAYYAREREVELAHAERDLRSKRRLITELRKDKAREEEEARRLHEYRPVVERVFDRWRVETGRERCKLTPERFDMAIARLAEGYDEGAITMAVVGIARHPYVIDGEARNNFETAVKEGSQVERYANRCPREMREQLSGRLFE